MRNMKSASVRESSFQKGTTLVEVLVAMLILAIGLLGLVGLQTNSLRSTQNAYLRTQATVYAEDMIERMRSNPQGVTVGGYMAASGATSAACLSAAGCSAGAMALHDLAEWVCALCIDI
ncbi:MAG: type IV pilus modification protein PilV, partial [Pseudomonadota bacterium]